MMEELSDVIEGFRMMRDAKRAKHQEWFEKNMKTIRESGIPFRSNSSVALLFREKGKPKVDFYPHTGRWRAPSRNRTLSGGASAFLKWYAIQTS